MRASTQSKLKCAVESSGCFSEVGHPTLSPVFSIFAECIVDAQWGRIAADKSMSVLLGRPICLRDEDCTLHFPKEVDDE